MKIYFSGSIAGRNNYQANYRQIIKWLINLGNQVNYEYLFENTPEQLKKQDRNQQIDVHKKLEGYKRECDVMVAELSYRSFAQGQEIAYAFRIGKPVLGLYVKGQRPHLIVSDAGDRLLLVEYNLDNLKARLIEGLEYLNIHEMKRFTLNLPAHLISYLDRVSRDTPISRSEFIRQVLEEHILKRRGE